MFIPLIAVTVFILLFLWSSTRQGPLARAISSAIEEDSPDPLLQELQRKPIDFIGRFFHRLITPLWDGDQRELAASFALRFVQLHPQVGRGHVWIGKIICEEPEISGRIFSPGFLDEHYDPNARCGAG